LKYKTNQAQDVKKVEKLNNLFIRLMSSKTVDASTAAAITAAIEQEGILSCSPHVETILISFQQRPHMLFSLNSNHNNRRKAARENENTLLCCYNANMDLA
jgi:hypothetical protein